MRRKRITITLKEDVIKSIDKIIDGKKIRNRSNAIEVILEQNFISDLSTAVILATGFSKIFPDKLKCLVDINGKSVIEYILKRLVNANFKKVFVCSHSIEKIVDHLKNNPEFSSLELVFVKEPETLGGTAGALNFIEDKLEGKDFLLIYGDVLAEINLSDFVDFFKNTKSLCCMALTSVMDPRKWGVIKMKGNQITNFEEKPQENVFSYLVNSGIYLMKGDIFKHLKNHISLEKEVLPVVARSGELDGYVFDGLWFDTGEKEMYEKALISWKK